MKHSTSLKHEDRRGHPEGSRLQVCNPQSLVSQSLVSGFAFTMYDTQDPACSGQH
jgi:hypothetical protein